MKNTILFLLFIPLLSFGQQKSMESITIDKINPESKNPVHSILLYVEQENQNSVFNKGFGKLDKQSEEVSEDNRFRIASSTKLFIATIILQLVEENKIKLDEKANKYLEQIDYLDYGNIHAKNNRKFAREISIKQLLSHRTGLADIFMDREEAFFSILEQNPQKQYTPKSIIELYYQLGLNNSAHFQPGSGWNYSDMNYVLLGLIIELVDQTELPKAIRNRILTPLKMEHTYFEFYETPGQEDNRVSQYVGDVNFTEINTSFDWAGGGLVSTNKDLSIFIKALFDLKLINRESLNKMIDVKYTKQGENRYGLGIYESQYNGKTYFGHYGFYGTYIGYCPENRTVISYCISQATTEFNVGNYVNEILKLSK